MSLQPTVSENGLTEAEVRLIIRTVMDDEDERRAKALKDAVGSIFQSFGMDEDDRKELSADFQHLRKWRKSVESATNLTVKVIVTTLISGVIGAIVLGIQTKFGR